MPAGQTGSTRRHAPGAVALGDEGNGGSRRVQLEQVEIAVFVKHSLELIFLETPSQDHVLGSLVVDLGNLRPTRHGLDHVMAGALVLAGRAGHLMQIDVVSNDSVDSGSRVESVSCGEVVIVHERRLARGPQRVRTKRVSRARSERGAPWTCV